MSFNELLAEEENVDLLRICTAGSVDDGKSTLIGRLLYDSGAIFDDHLASITRQSKAKGMDVDFSYFTDGLKAEREQGITIDVAYRYFRTKKRRFIIADSPGHEEYTRNMATGASLSDLALLLVDARKKITTQSKRHGFIASLLGIKHILVVINKMDLVGYDKSAYEEIAYEYRQYAARLGIPDLTFIPVSALYGENITSHSVSMAWYEGPTLISYLENIYVIGSRNLIDLRFPIQNVIRPHQDFRGYCGQIASGVMRVGDAVTILPSKRQSRIKEISSFNQKLQYAHALQSVTISLEHDIDASRGDIIVHSANQPRIEAKPEVMLIWFDNEPAKLNKPYIIKHTTRWIKGEIAKIYYRVAPNTLRQEPSNTLSQNEIGRAELHLQQSLYCDNYSSNKVTGSLIIVDPISNRTVGAGILIQRREKQTSDAPGDTKQLAYDAPINPGTHAIALWRYLPSTIWLTGLSGSGKTTVAKEFQRRLYLQGRPCVVLDGDSMRAGVNSDLGFAANERSENIRRVAEIAKELNDNGILVIVALISPFRADREKARKVIGGERFVEVYINASFDTCQKRDVKGLYKRALSGEIKEFTGLSSRYEPPLSPELVMETENELLDTTVDHLISYLRNNDILLT